MKKTLLTMTLILSMSAIVMGGPDEYQYMPAVGGTGGQERRPLENQAATRLRSIQVACSRYIDRIRFTYETTNGGVFEIILGSGQGGEWQPTVDIPEGVHLVGISGRYGRFVDSIKFTLSNGWESPLYGGTGGVSDYREFVPKVEGQYQSEIFSLWGRTDRFTDAVGAVVKNLKK